MILSIKFSLHLEENSTYWYDRCKMLLHTGLRFLLPCLPPKEEARAPKPKRAPLSTPQKCQYRRSSVVGGWWRMNAAPFVWMVGKIPPFVAKRHPSRERRCCFGTLCEAQGHLFLQQKILWYSIGTVLVHSVCWRLPEGGILPREATTRQD